MLKANLTGLDELVRRFNDPGLRNELNKIPSLKGVAAIISQAIADNFEKEGPGWAPLKAATLRASVKKAVIKKLESRFLRQLGFHNKKTGEVHKSKAKLTTEEKRKLNKAVNSQLLAHERNARTSTNKKKSDTDKSKVLANRKILQKTGLLKKTATVIGFTGSSKPSKNGKSFTGSNIYNVQGTNLVWGTNLVYAAAHNNGDPSHNIPKREFLVIRDEWKRVLNNFIATKAVEMLTKYIVRGK